MTEGTERLSPEMRRESVEQQSATEASSGSSDASTGELLAQLSEQSSLLVRKELALAQAELQQKAKRAGLGAGLFGGAGLVALYGVGTLLATVILALALVVPPWLAALIVTAVLFAVAGVAALLGKKKVSQATPLAPEQTIDNVKADMATLKGQRP
jgi:uncharacterized membrane protein YqjE